MTWLNDTQTWKDVYRKKPIEFLRIVAEGSEPVWDSESKQFVAKIDEAGTQSYQQPQMNMVASQPQEESVPTELGEPMSLDTDDLPF